MGLTPATDTHAMVFVDGPYKSAKKANASAASLRGVEIAQRGGLYDVTAELTSHLGKQVRAVAACLGGSGGSHSRSYTF